MKASVAVAEKVRACVMTVSQTWFNEKCKSVSCAGREYSARQSCPKASVCTQMVKDQRQDNHAANDRVWSSVDTAIQDAD